MKIIVHIAIYTVAIFITALILPGIQVHNFFTSFIVAVVLGTLNTFIKPIIFWITLPLTILTFGLFSLILNGVFVLLAGLIVPGFHVSGILWAILFSIVVWLINSFLQKLGDEETGPHNEE